MGGTYKHGHGHTRIWQVHEDMWAYGHKDMSMETYVCTDVQSWDTYDTNSFAQQQQRVKMDIGLIRYQLIKSGGGGLIINMDMDMHAYGKYTRTCGHKDMSMGTYGCTDVRSWDTYDLNSFAQQQQRAKMDIGLLRY